MGVGSSKAPISIAVGENGARLARSRPKLALPIVGNEFGSIVGVPTEFGVASYL